MKNFLYLLLLLGMVFYLSSCAGPVAKVLNDPVKFGIVRDTVFARGLCLNDTITSISRKDSVVYRDTTITKTVKVNTPTICRIDTLVNGQHIVLVDGRITITNTTPCKDRLRTVTKTFTVRDKSRENVYAKQRDDALNHQQRTQQALDVAKLKLDKAEAVVKLKTLTSWLLLAALGVTGGLLLKKTFLV